MGTSISLAEGQRNYLRFGLVWERLLGDSPAKEVAGSARMLKARRAVQVHGLESVVGYDTDKPLRGKSYAAAAWFAQSLRSDVEHAVLFYLLPKTADQEEAQVALIGIRDRIPAVGYDCVGAFEDMVGLGHTFVAGLEGQQVTAIFDGDFAPVQVAQFAPGRLGSVFDDAPPEAALLSAPPGAARLLPAVAAAVCLGVAVLGGNAYWKDQKAKAATAAKPDDPVAMYVRSRDQVLASDYLAPARVEMEGLAAFLRSLPSATGGWRLKEVHCSGRTCVASWSTTAATYDDFKAARQGGGILSFAMDGQSLTEALSVPAPRGQRLELDRLKPPQAAAESVAPWIQTLRLAGVAASFRALELVGSWAGPAAPPPGFHGLVRRGGWQFSGPFDAVADGMSMLPDYMTISSVALRIEAEGSPTLMIGGSYYVQG